MKSPPKGFCKWCFQLWCGLRSAPLLESSPVFCFVRLVPQVDQANFQGSCMCKLCKQCVFLVLVFGVLFFLFLLFLILFVCLGLGLLFPKMALGGLLWVSLFSTHALPRWNSRWNPYWHRPMWNKEAGLTSWVEDVLNHSTTAKTLKLCPWPKSFLWHLARGISSTTCNFAVQSRNCWSDFSRFHQISKCQIKCPHGSTFLRRCGRLVADKWGMSLQTPDPLRQ